MKAKRRPFLNLTAPTIPVAQSIPAAPTARNIPAAPTCLTSRASLGTMAIAATIAIAAFGTATFSPAVLAQGNWPTKAIRVVVPFPPGGGTDKIAREVTQKVGDNTGWTFVVDNKPGAGGNLGVDAVAKAAPDGYTIVLGQTSNLAINPTLYPKLPYDPARDLAPIVAVASAPLVLVTGADTPFKSLADVVKAAKADPGKLNFASPGNGTVAHLSSELLQKAAGFKTQHVPYKGVAQALSDVVSGTVDLYMSSVPTLLSQLKIGKIRALAVTSTERLADLPDVPTVDESGYRGFETSTWFGILARAGTPADVIARMNDEFNKALKDEGLVKRLEAEGAIPLGGTPEQFAELIRTETPRWGQVVQESGAKIE